MSNLPPERLQRAKWLLANIKHAAMATVNADGTPHNTPYLFMHSHDLNELYWGSSPKSLHSQNIERTGQAFIVLYEADKGGGLYVKCQNARVAKDAELERALKAHNDLRVGFGKEPLDSNYYQAPSEQRMYITEPVEFWVNYAEKDDAGHIRQDKRIAVAKQELLSLN